VHFKLKTGEECQPIFVENKLLKHDWRENFLGKQYGRWLNFKKF
jgi:hypothetical protein